MSFSIFILVIFILLAILLGLMWSDENYSGDQQFVMLTLCVMIFIMAGRLTYEYNNKEKYISCKDKEKVVFHGDIWYRYNCVVDMMVEYQEEK